MQGVPAVPEISCDRGTEDRNYRSVRKCFHTVDGFALKDMNTHNESGCASKDTPMGNLITDSYRNKTHTKIRITANGLIAEKRSTEGDNKCRCIQNRQLRI
ncbi:MAG: hypothetical protein IPL53_17175 [Ignavibacteria bacterium]|nr:hypothetical protein [Ignavibacteria bacterium]